MNKRQKLVQEAFLDNEEKVIKRLKTVYTKSLDDITKKTKVLQDEINSLNALADLTDDLDEKARLKSMEQSKIYQKQYQDALKKQVSSILDNMQVEAFTDISSYLQTCYEDGFVGTMYDLHGQGIPLIMPIDQEAMVRAVQLDSKISEGLYNHLGEDVSMLKKHITAQVSRGISSGMSYAQVAQQLSAKMIGAYENPGGSLAYAMRIARTEGHRIQVQSSMDACYKAKEKGANVVKQWDSTLDDSTRESHQQVDGEIRELDEPFSNGLMFPGDPSGGAAEVIHCRCALLQRAKWALDKDELQTLQDRAAFYGLDKTQNFDDFKKKYLKATEDLTNNVKSDIMSAEKFVPAKDRKEAEKRMSDALGVQEVKLGRMSTELANQYLEGTERFMKDFPMLKGYYNTVGTKTGAPGIMGVNKLTGKYIDGGKKIELSCELHFKSPKDLKKMLADYEAVSKAGGSYENSTPLSTAIHELVHGMDHAITFKKHGCFDKNGLGIIERQEWNNATAGVSRKIIHQVRQEMFGAQYGKEVADATRYLGRYARTSPSEELAEAISYEYVNPSNPYSARILELFKEEVKGAF